MENGGVRSVIVAWRCLVGEEGAGRRMMRCSEFVARSLLQVQTEERVHRVQVQDYELHARHHMGEPSFEERSSDV